MTSLFPFLCIRKSLICLVVFIYRTYIGPCCTGSMHSNDGFFLIFVFFSFLVFFMHLQVLLLYFN